MQAPTGSIAGTELASAVCRAGGLGALGLTWTAPETAASMVADLVTQGHSFLVNFALAFAPASLAAVLEAGAPVVTFSWGCRRELIESAKGSGAVVGVQVGNVPGAERALECGADFLVLQGFEAGGHVQSTQPLRRLLADTRSCLGAQPILVAAGGIGSGEDAALCMNLGADAVMLGTRFVASEESLAHADYKEALRAADGSDTALTVCFDGGWPGAPHRVLRNCVLDDWEAAGCPTAPNRPQEGREAAVSASGEPILYYEDTAPREGMRGEVLNMALYAGTGVGRIRSVKPAEEIVREICIEAGWRLVD